jgi:hypothetical protein
MDGPRGADAAKTGRSEYVFKDDILTELRRDLDGDGKLDDWRTFDRGYLVHLEMDLDHDGEPDWRESWKRPANLQIAYELKNVEGRWRLFPSAYYLEGHNQHISREGINNVLFNYTGHAERRVDGKWTDTFEESHTYTTGGNDLCGVGAAPPSQWKHLIQYRNGVPVKGSITTAGLRHDFEWKDGLAAQWIQLAGKEKTVSNYERGKYVSYETTDANGENAVLHPLNNGQGDGTVRSEARNEAGDVIYRQVRTRDIRNDTAEMKISGTWTGDFEKDGIVYRNGKAIKQTFAPGSPIKIRVVHEVQISTEKWPAVILNHPSPEVDEWSDGKLTHFWARYDPENSQLLYEALDLDGDGKPDVIADYVKLTLTQPEQR